MAYKVWYAKDAGIKLGLASAITIPTTGALDTAFTAVTSVEGTMKDITIKEPIPDVEKLDFLGEDTNGFQNAEIEEKPAPLVEITGTMILPGDEVTESIVYGATSATGTGYTRYRAGKATVTKIAFCLNLDDGTDEVNYAGDDFYYTARETKVTGADGHFEVSCTMKGLPRNWYGPEFKN